MATLPVWWCSGRAVRCRGGEAAAGSTCAHAPRHGQHPDDPCASAVQCHGCLTLSSCLLPYSRRPASPCSPAPIAPARSCRVCAKTQRRRRRARSARAAVGRRCGGLCSRRRGQGRSRSARCAVGPPAPRAEAPRHEPLAQQPLIRCARHQQQCEQPDAHHRPGAHIARTRGWRLQRVSGPALVEPEQQQPVRADEEGDGGVQGVQIPQADQPAGLCV
mmetsp:Transcript_30698/g.78448  ORF Transcript_30698/g.78448 Transcript_30698/m.78448 type:complete len:218 (+) Transcript_30698:687-1340(+)